MSLFLAAVQQCKQRPGQLVDDGGGEASDRSRQNESFVDRMRRESLEQRLQRVRLAAHREENLRRLEARRALLRPTPAKSEREAEPRETPAAVDTGGETAPAPGSTRPAAAAAAASCRKDGPSEPAGNNASDASVQQDAADGLVRQPPRADDAESAQRENCGIQSGSQLQSAGGGVGANENPGAPPCGGRKSRAEPAGNNAVQDATDGVVRRPSRADDTESAQRASNCGIQSGVQLQGAGGGECGVRKSRAEPAGNNAVQDAADGVGRRPSRADDTELAQRRESNCGTQSGIQLQGASGGVGANENPGAPCGGRNGRAEALQAVREPPRADDAESAQRASNCGIQSGVQLQGAGGGENPGPCGGRKSRAEALQARGDALDRLRESRRAAALGKIYDAAAADGTPGTPRTSRPFNLTAVERLLAGKERVARLLRAGEREPEASATTTPPPQPAPRRSECEKTDTEGAQTATPTTDHRRHRQITCFPVSLKTTGTPTNDPPLPAPRRGPRPNIGLTNRKEAMALPEHLRPRFFDDHPTHVLAMYPADLLRSVDAAQNPVRGRPREETHPSLIKTYLSAHAERQASKGGPLFPLGERAQAAWDRRKQQSRERAADRRTATEALLKQEEEEGSHAASHPAPSAHLASSAQPTKMAKLCAVVEAGGPSLRAGDGGLGAKRPAHPVDILRHHVRDALLAEREVEQAARAENCERADDVLDAFLRLENQVRNETDRVERNKGLAP
ncbi:hypothetical protein DIPPA_06994 [Diplonema papillatum]|nr:hypothetical protein DIPPA_06994 [Diplonema papillatum]